MFACFDFFWGWGQHPAVLRVYLLLTLHTEITPGGTKGNICGLRDQTQTNYMQSKWLTNCIIFPARFTILLMIELPCIQFEYHILLQYTSISEVLLPWAFIIPLLYFFFPIYFHLLFRLKHFLY